MATSAASVETYEIVESLKSGSDETINNCKPISSPSPSASTSSTPSPPPTNFTVFNATTGPNSTATGGWTSVRADGTTDPILTISSDSIGLRAPYWCDGDAYTVKNIDFRNVKSMTLTFSSSGVSPSYFYAGLG